MNNQIVFRNMGPSHGLRRAIEEGIDLVSQKFPMIARGDIRCAVECRNSRTQAGPDRYDVVLNFAGSPWGDVHLTKSAENPYKGLELALDRFEEILGRLNRKIQKRNREVQRADA